VIAPLPVLANADQHMDTGESMLRRPRSASCNTAVVVAINLVSDARSKIVSFVIACGTGCGATDAPFAGDAIAPDPSQQQGTPRWPKRVAKRRPCLMACARLAAWLVFVAV
jgi:hypothetical protein